MISIAVVGNKCDLGKDEIKVSSDEAEEFAKENNVMYFETSAKTGKNIKELFNKLAGTVYKKIETGAINLSTPEAGVKKGNNEDSKKLKRNNGRKAKKGGCTC
eukprot:TRINITY_DN10136_c0_g2_i2.p1 TRINITY_DN10136_c0_g2~~TRINITY_DN10136_c0_g2_i2.p1  ORF type:complete len:103 (+),score=26.37 TRINITY_DN10136_c0_g2_i2:252-560(+)